MRFCIYRDMAGEYNPIRAETSAENKGSLRYAIPDIPVGWKLDKTYDFNVIAFSDDGQIVENLSNSYLSFDESSSTLTVAPVFGQKDFCVYIFRDEEAVNLFAIKSDGNASLVSILAQFEKDNRVLKQLQALQGRSLRTPDECKILPEAGTRAGKILCFGEDGQPVVDVAYIDIVKVREYREAAEAAKADAEAATKNAQAAQKSASADASRADNAKDEAYDILLNVQSSNNEVATMLSLTQDAKSDAESAKAAAEAAQTAAETAKTNAYNFAGAASKSKTDAQAAKTAAEAAKADAVAAKESAAADRVLAEGAKVAAQNAKSAAVAAQAAAELAKNQAAEIVDPDNRIGQLFQTKLDKGVLYCNGGYAKVPQAAFTSLSKCSMLIRFARDGSTLTSEESLCNLGDGGTASTGISVRLSTAKKMHVLCLFKRADGTYDANGSHVPSFDVSGYLDGKLHSLAVCWSGTKTRVFIDGELKEQSATLESGLSILTSALGITVGVRYAALASYPLYFRGRVSDFAVLNYDASEVDSDGNYTSAYSIADYQNGRAIPPWTVPIVFGNGKSASANTVNAACVWSGANWSMTQASNAATVKSMLYYIPLNVGQKLRIKFSNLTGGVLVDGKYGFFQPVRQEADQIDVSTTSLNAEFTAATPITYWRFQFNCEAVDDAADRVATVFENFTVERDGAVVALENYTIARNTTTKLIKDASGNGQDATVSGVLSGDRDNAVAAFVDELKTQISQQS